MICSNCNIDRSVTDFVKNQEFCYRCEYQKKLEKARQKRTRRVAFCRVCGNEVIHKENLKKRQRTVFCSCECAQKGHKELTKNYWCRKIPTGKTVNIQQKAV